MNKLKYALNELKSPIYVGVYIGCIIGTFLDLGYSFLLILPTGWFIIEYLSINYENTKTF